MSALLLKNISSLFIRQGQELSDADLLIESGKISGVGTKLSEPHNAQIIDCRGKVVLPGLINSHHHFFQTMTRCLPGAQNVGLFDWLTYHYPVWRHLDEAMMMAAFRLAIAELLLTGCTTTSDHLYLFPAKLQADLIEMEVIAARDLGIRFCGTRGSMSLGKSRGGLPPDDVVESDDKVLLHSESCIKRFHDANPYAMCQMHLAPCSPFNVTKELMQETAVLARNYGVRLHTHLAETKDEEQFCREKYKCTPLEWMEELGWVGDDVWFAHGIYFSDRELDSLAHHHCGISYCASSNMRLGSGVARIPEMIQKRIPVGLAVDGSASNDSGNMLGELRQAMLLTRAIHGTSALSARQAINLATAGSAALLGRNKLGTLEAGMAADVAIFDINSIDFAGAADPVAALIFCGISQRAWMVIVNGKVVVEDGHLVCGNENMIAETAREQSRKLWQKAGVL